MPNCCTPRNIVWECPITYLRCFGKHMSAKHLVCLRHIVTFDETWVRRYTPESEQASMEGWKPGEAAGNQDLSFYWESCRNDLFSMNSAKLMLRTTAIPTAWWNDTGQSTKKPVVPIQSTVLSQEKLETIRKHWNIRLQIQIYCRVTISCLGHSNTQYFTKF